MTTGYRQTSCSALIQDKVFFGGCGQNSSNLTNNVLTYYNVTTPTPVPKPGSRNGGGICDCTIEWNDSSSGTHWASNFLDVAEWWQSASFNQDMLAVQTFNSGSTVNLGKCQNVGHKEAMGLRFWYGSYGFISNDSLSCGTTSSIGPDQTKYLTCTFDAHFSNLEDFDGSSDAGDLTGVRTVNSSSGIITSSLISTETIKSGQITPGTPVITYYTNGGAGYSYDGTTTTTFTSGGGTKLDFGIDLHCTFPAFAIGVGLGTLADYITSWNSGHPSATVPTITDPNSYSGHASSTSFGTTSTFDAEFSRDNTTVTWDFSTSFPTDNPGAPLVHYSYNGTLTLSDTNTALSVYGDIVNLLNYWRIDNNAIMPWRPDSFTMYMPKICRREVQSAAINPMGFNAYTMNDMTDPVYVSGSIDHYGQIAWKDPNSFYWMWAPGSSSILATGMGDNHYDGAIIGKPFVVNTTTGSITGAPISDGSGSSQVYGWFDFYTDDIRFCLHSDDPSCSGPPYVLYTYRHGGTLSDAVVSTSGLTTGPSLDSLLPNCATHWNNNIESHTIPKGGSVSFGVVNGAIVVVKYAECRPKYASYNFFRPCGSDRSTIDELSAQCFIVGDLIMENALPTASCEILLAYTNGYDGIYTGSSQTLRGDTHYDLTLGTKIRDLPSNYNHVFATEFNSPDDWGTYGLVGMVRFPNAYSICGRQNVTVITGSNGSGSIFTFDIGQPNLATNDKITLYNTTMSLVATASLYRNTDTEFTSSWNVSSSLASGSFLMLGWAQSSGSPDYHWQDTTQKLTYREGQWSWTNRTSSASSSSMDGCVPGSPCAESVVAFSPNSESFSNGVTKWFSGSLDGFDGVYGNMQQLNVEFGMIDPLYQKPKFPSSVLDFIFPSFVQDPGSCPPDNFDIPTAPILYYGPPRFVEAMQTVPSGSPGLPIAQGQFGPYQITWQPMLIPPLPGVVGISFNSPQQPWQFYSNEVNTCVNNPDCRFISEYSCLT